MNKVLTKVPFRFEIDFRDIFQNKHLSKEDSTYYLYAFIVHLVNMCIIYIRVKIVNLDTICVMLDN